MHDFPFNSFINVEIYKYVKKCVKCGKEIPEDETYCATCLQQSKGKEVVLANENADASVTNKTSGEEVIKQSEQMAAASKDADRVEEKTESESSTVPITNHEDELNLKKNKKKNLIIFSIIGVCILLVAGIGIKFYMDDQAHKKYVEEYNAYLSLVTETQLTMLNGGAKAETIGNDLKTTWNNAIWKKDDATTDKYTKVDGVFVEDFNTAITAYYTDSDVKKIFLI